MGEGPTGTAWGHGAPGGAEVAFEGLGDDFGTSGRSWRFRNEGPRGSVRVGSDPAQQLHRAFDDGSADGGDAIDPNASLYGGAYDGTTLSEGELKSLFQRPPSTWEWYADRGRIRPDDVRKARQMGLIDDAAAQHLANESLDALERRGVTDLPQQIRYTHAGPFYFRIGKDDTDTLRQFKQAVGMDPDRRAHQATNSQDVDWNDAALRQLQQDEKLQVVDRFGQQVDIFSKTEIDGRQERLINPKLSYRSIDYEAHPEHGDAKREHALDGDFVMIEAWNQDLSRPQPGTVYEVPSYESPRFNDGERVHIHSDETKLWRFETLPEPDAKGRARVGHVSGEVNLVARPREQIAARLTEQNGVPPDEQTLNQAVRDHERSRGWAKNQGMEYVRYTKDQSPAGNQAMIEAGMRVPEDGVPYPQSEDRYNGGHVIAASLGGMGEGINVTAQAEANNQDKWGWVNVDGEWLRMNESWHDWERHMKNLSALEADGLTVDQLQVQGFVVSDAVRQQYGDQPVQFDVNTSIRNWYEDEASTTEDPSTRHTREFARFTHTRLTDRQTGQVIGSLTMANYNVGASDQDYDAKMQMLFEAGFVDRDGGYADDADMGAFAGSKERAPDVNGAGTLDESLPSVGQLHTFANSPEFAQIWGPNAWP